MHVTFPEFLSNLYSSGRVRVGRPEEIAEEELRGADSAIAAFETQYRRDLPGEPPEVCMPAARWAAMMVYRACQFAAFREIPEAAVVQSLSLACPEGDPPSVHYSVDLSMRFLPDLVKLARSAAERDPLVTQLAALAAQWPLSSVGVAGVGTVDVEPLVGHPCLLGMYVDRVIARRDTARLSDPRVCEAVRRALGLFPELAPEMAVAVAAEANDPWLQLEKTQ
jgi:hypothetical protein